jgi:hypothetical protein
LKAKEYCYQIKKKDEEKIGKKGRRSVLGASEKEEG